MNTNLLRILIVAAVACAATAAEIPAGTHLLLSMENSINTHTTKIGDAVHFRTVTPISAGGKIVVPVGSYAQGVVTQTKRSRMHGQAQFQIQVVRLVLPSGEVLDVSPRPSSLAPPTERESRRVDASPRDVGIVFAGLAGGALLGSQLGGESGADTGAYVGLGVALTAVVVHAIMAKPKEIELRQGTAVDVVFDQPVTID